MNVLAVLWTVCLVRLCSTSCCGGGDTTDDNGPGVLDLANPDKSLFSTLNGRLGTLYLHKSGKEITEVFYGRSRLWKAEDGQGCKWVEVAIDSKGNGMAHIYLKNQGYTEIPFKAVLNNTGSSSTSNQSGDNTAKESSHSSTTTPSQSSQ
ncbi:signal peptide containing protein [Theileria equi strain WA]|uniref:Signal peptide containing protein n=1 Tax=Theileria equi strain WA TaxID=1537102 RepID=L1LBM2_THEEQ|nr:signal peptide containing protein [Theileria equi strain WA]EKX72731.1 signal peptide containing protein [Theileria equi strain WA]|eukprot:XP_004832183.1 signal peptide containing protein [Theileria equi strain WA]